MATKAVQGKLTSVYVDHLNASPYLQEYEVDSQRDDTDVTAFEADDKEFITSAAENDVTLTGFWNGEEGSLDELLFLTYGTDVQNVVTLMPAGSLAVARGCLLVPGTQVGMNISAAADEQQALEADFKSRLVPGRVLKTPVPQTATGASASPWVSPKVSQLGLSANLHVVALSHGVTTPTAITVEVEHGPDGTDWDTLVTFDIDPADPLGGYTASTLKTLEIEKQIRYTTTITGGTTPSLLYLLAAGRRA